MLTKLKTHGRSLGYPKNLLDPIVVPSADTLALMWALSGKDRSSTPTTDDLYRTERLRKFKQLAVHYNLEAPECASDLAMCIANDWVPGFKQAATKPRKRGAPKSSIDSDAEFYCRVTLLMRDEKLSLRKACERFQKEAASGSRWKAVTLPSIENKYRNLKKRLSEGNERTRAYLLELSEPKKKAANAKPRSLGIRLGMPRSK